MHPRLAAVIGALVACPMKGAGYPGFDRRGEQHSCAIAQKFHQPTVSGVGSYANPFFEKRLAK